MARAGSSTSISSTQKASAEVDDYIAAAPKAAQPLLNQLRNVIKENAPQAEERISYRMPYYDYKGRLVYFAVFKNHLSLYPAHVEEAKELIGYMTGKGTYQFPVDEPLPVAKIAKLVKRRVKENERAAAEKAAARSSHER